MASIEYMDKVNLNLLHKYKNINKRGSPFELQEPLLKLLKESANVLEQEFTKPCNHIG